MQIEKERFEAWLLSRPDKESYWQWDASDCLIARFIRETTNLKRFTIFENELDTSRRRIAFPSWLTKTWNESIVKNSRMGPVKKYWRNRWLKPEKKKVIEKTLVAA